MTRTAIREDLEAERGLYPLGFGLLGILGIMTLFSQFVVCCLWGTAVLLGFDPFRED